MTRLRPAMLLVFALAVGLSGCADEPAVHPGQAVLVRARQAYDDGDDASAMAHAEAFLAATGPAPESAEGLYIRALARWRQGDLPAAEDDLRLVVERTYRNDLAGRAWLGLSDLAETRGDEAAALLAAERAVERLPLAEPPADEALYRAARLYQRAGRWAEADLLLDRILYLHPQSPRAEAARRRIRAMGWTIVAGTFDPTDPRQQDRISALQADLAALDQPLSLSPVGWADSTVQLQVGQFSTYEQSRQALAEVERQVPAARPALRFSAGR